MSEPFPAAETEGPATRLREGFTRYMAGLREAVATSPTTPEDQRFSHLVTETFTACDDRLGSFLTADDHDSVTVAFQRMPAKTRAAALQALEETHRARTAYLGPASTSSDLIVAEGNDAGLLPLPPPVSALLLECQLLLLELVATSSSAHPSAETPPLALVDQQIARVHAAVEPLVARLAGGDSPAPPALTDEEFSRLSATLVTEVSTCRLALLAARAGYLRTGLSSDTKIAIPDLRAAFYPPETAAAPPSAPRLLFGFELLDGVGMEALDALQALDTARSVLPLGWADRSGRRLPEEFIAVLDGLFAAAQHEILSLVESAASPRQHAAASLDEILALVRNRVSDRLARMRGCRSFATFLTGLPPSTDSYADDVYLARHTPPLHALLEGFAALTPEAQEFTLEALQTTCTKGHAVAMWDTQPINACGVPLAPKMATALRYVLSLIGEAPIGNDGKRLWQDRVVLSAGHLRHGACMLQNHDLQAWDTVIAAIQEIIVRGAFTPLPASAARHPTISSSFALRLSARLQRRAGEWFSAAEPPQSFLNQPFHRGNKERAAASYPWFTPGSSPVGFSAGQ
jgi:hypothetical protein